jgi:hypothetical protein
MGIELRSIATSPPSATFEGLGCGAVREPRVLQRRRWLRSLAHSIYASATKTFQRAESCSSHRDLPHRTMNANWEHEPHA